MLCSFPVCVAKVKRKNPKLALIIDTGLVAPAACWMFMMAIGLDVRGAMEGCNAGYGPIADLIAPSIIVSSAKSSAGCPFSRMICCAASACWSARWSSPLRE